MNENKTNTQNSVQKSASLKPKKPKTPPRIRPSIKKDRINPSDFNLFNFKLSCEDCSHFCSSETRCTLGFNTEPHRLHNVMKDYLLSGKTAQCRFLEID